MSASDLHQGLRVGQFSLSRRLHTDVGCPGLEACRAKSLRARYCDQSKRLDVAITEDKICGMIPRLAWLSLYVDRVKSIKVNALYLLIKQHTRSPQHKSLHGAA